MIGLGRVWKAVTGGKGDAAPTPPASTIPRDITAPRTVVSFEPASSLDDAEPSETRSAERFVPNKTATMLTTVGGKRFAARIINISRTGVAVEPEAAGFGSEDIALVGTRPVTPGRRIALGMVFLFKKPLDPKLCGPDLIL
ncbi:hypothetical protein D3273_02705 [Lichenibacterium minor]|uniref:PilZ domain-containing protein n=1 Tax=Lichenibacterium minor TaxID=2316528 RepID=A0A4Q2UA52_9HYPH|nr:hypothetical protein [Lichenibacterium minor]RYC33402.1 hypothetical protein D3273_02705 [Lichenibacterium minor]